MCSLRESATWWGFEKLWNSKLWLQRHLAAAAQRAYCRRPWVGAAVSRLRQSQGSGFHHFRTPIACLPPLSSELAADRRSDFLAVSDGRMVGWIQSAMSTSGLFRLPYSHEGKGLSHGRRPYEEHGKRGEGFCTVYLLIFTGEGLPICTRSFWRQTLEAILDKSFPDFSYFLRFRPSFLRNPRIRIYCWCSHVDSQF